MEGNCKGAIFRGNIEYVLKKHGKLGLQQVMEDMLKNNYHLDLENMKDGHWFPLDARMQFLKSTTKIFDLDNEQLLLLGRSGFNKSAIAQFYLTLAGSPKMIFDIGAKVWKHNYDIGSLEAEYNGPEGSYFRVFDFDADPIFFVYLVGYYTSAFEKVGAKNLVITHEPAEFNGKKCHEFLIKWD
ncbi:MAG: hypothetical protein KAJ33_06950 [Thermoplasmata archaeon]|nr:hypothetical protein [Thermoplasmata archaeon]